MAYNVWTVEVTSALAPLVVEEMVTGDKLLYEAVNAAVQRSTLGSARVFKSNQEVINTRRLWDAIQSHDARTAAEIRGKMRISNHKGKNFIRWDAGEKEQVARGSVAALRAGAKNLLTAVREAQKMLPPGRQKNILSSWQISDEVEKRIGVLQATLPHQPHPVEPAADVPLSWTPPPLDVQVTPVSEHVAPIAAESPNENALLLRKMEERMSSMELVLMHILEALDPKAKQSDAVQAAVEAGATIMRKVHKPKVLIVGLLSDQFQRIEERWGEFFNLSWHSSQRSEQISLDRLKNADYTIGVVRWMNHPTEYRIKTTVQPERYFRANNPTRDVNTIMENLFAANHSAAVAAPATSHVHH